MGNEAGISSGGSRVDAATGPAMTRRRSAAMVVAIVVVPAVAAYVVLWLGGAAEILTYQDSAPGTSCLVPSSISSVEVGYEARRWVGGGLLVRPGVVCVVQMPSRPVDQAEASSRQEVRRLSQADVLSALLAALTCVIAAVTVEAWFRKQL